MTRFLVTTVAPKLLRTLHDTPATALLPVLVRRSPLHPALNTGGPAAACYSLSSSFRSAAAAA